MAANGKTKIIMYLVSCLFTIVVVIAIPALASNMITNDRRNASERKEIRRDIIEGDARVMSKVDKIEDIVTEIRLEQRSLTQFIKGKL